MNNIVNTSGKLKDTLDSTHLSDYLTCRKAFGKSFVPRKVSTKKIRNYKFLLLFVSKKDIPFCNFK